MADQNEVLTLDRIEPRRRQVSFGGTLYDLLDPADVGPRLGKRIHNLSRVIYENLGDEDLTGEQEVQLVTGLDQMLLIILPTMPEPERRELTYYEKIAIFNHWVPGFTIPSTAPAEATEAAS